MIARLARLLLLFQLLVAMLFSMLFYTRLLQGYAGLSLLLGITVVVIVRLAITANSFILSRRYRSPTQLPVRIGFLAAARLFSAESFASMQSSSWTMAFCAFHKRHLADAVGLPVVLVHGYGCNSGYWHAMSKALTAARISHHAVTLEPILAPIEQYLPTLHQSIRTLLADSGTTRVVLVGHSMGGLVCRAYLREHGSAHVAKVITIGTPHHGTTLANHGIGHNARQMAMTSRSDGVDSSQWLQQLDKCETAVTRALFVSIYSQHDNIVSPQLSACLDGAVNIAVDAIGHVTLAMHKGVQQRVIQEIVATA